MTGAGEAGAGAAGGWSPPTTHGPGPGGGRGRRRRWPWVVLWTVVALAVVVAGAGTAVYFWADGRVRTTEAFGEYAGRPKAGKGTDWLLIGSDSRATLTPEQRRELHVGSNEVRNTDTLMIVHQGDHGTTMVSLPRDSYVAIPGHGQGKINSAFALGGPKLLTRTVEQATGLRLDHFAEVDFLGFVDVVGALGGVRICVPAGGLRDERSGADFAAGCQEMDGVQALSYVRARYSDPEGDLGRVRRQRQLVSAVAEKASSPAVALNPWRAGPFLSASLDAVTVDRGADVRDLFRLGRGLRGAADGPEGTGRALTVPLQSEGEVQGAGDVVVWDRRRAGELFAALREDRPIPTSDLK